MFLNTLESLNIFHTEVPRLPMGKYAHVVILRETNSFALFQTDGELNISRVSKGRKSENQDQATRIVLFKRKQSTPERLTGRELLRRYGLSEKGVMKTALGEQDYVLPQVYFPSVVTIKDPTEAEFIYVINNIIRTKRYGAQNTRTGTVENHVVGVIFADGEIFSNLQ